MPRQWLVETKYKRETGFKKYLSKHWYKIIYVLYLDSKNQKAKQKASTMSASTKGHLETLKQMSTTSQEQIQHSSKEHIIIFRSKWLIGLNGHQKI